MNKRAFLFLLGVTLLALVGGAALLISRASSVPRVVTRSAPHETTVVSDPLRVVLTPLAGDGPLDEEVRNLQSKIQQSPQANALLERLAWAFIAKARLSSDPGFYTLAEQAAKAITQTSPNDPAAALVLGHVYDSMHRFAEAEKIARALTERREFAFDYALLGDALMEQGKLTEAVEAYQKMVDLKPCLQTYSRVAHMRWLKGDLHGALDAIKLAVSAGSPREPEPSAWAYTRLAVYQLQAAEMNEASTSIDAALQFAVDYAPALLVRGRILLAQGKNGEAIAPLTRATEISPLPDYLWTLAEALRANDNIAQAEKVEARLAASAATADPRTFALYLASHGHDAELALQLASAELDSRQDVFTHDTVAWAQLATGDTQKARESIRLALAEGTEDGRLFYHAGAIALAAHANAEAFQFFAKAHALQQALLPSERHALSERIATLLRDAPQVSAK